MGYMLALAVSFIVYLCSGLLPYALSILAGGVVLAALALKAAFTPQLVLVSQRVAYRLLLCGWPLALLIALCSNRVDYQGLQTFSVLMALPLGLFVLAAIAPQQAKAEQLINGFVVLMGTQAAWLFVQFAFLREAFGYTANHPALTPHIPAVLCAMALCVVVWQLGQAGNRAQHLLFGGAGLVLIAGIFATNVQVPEAAALGAGLLLTVLSFAEHKRLQKRFFVFWLLVGLTIWGMDAYASFGLGDEIELIKGGIQLSQREYIWAAGFTAAKLNPFLGGGLGHYAELAAPFHHEYNRNVGLSAHNDLLQFWVELGVAAPLVLVVAGGLLLVFALRVYNAVKPSPMPAYVLGIGCVAVVSLTSSVLYDAAVLLGVALFAHACFFYDPQCHEQAVPHPIKQVVAASLLVGFGFIYGLGGYVYFKARAFEKALASNNVEQAFTALNDMAANSFNLHASPYMLRAAMAGSMIPKLAPHDPLRETLLKMTADDATHAAMLAPLAPEPVFQLAELARLQNQPEKRAAYLKKVLSLDPNHTPSRMALAIMLQEQGHKEEAYQLLRAARYWGSRNFPTWELKQVVLWRGWQAGDAEAVRGALISMAGNIEYADVELYKARFRVTP